MDAKYYRRFYLLSLAALAVLSAYPLINGVRMAYISMTSGALEPEQYAKYVVPYAAICVSLLFFAALLPVFQKLRRLAFPVGIGLSFGVFFAVECFFETMQIRVTGMTLIDAATLTPDAAASATATADIWQAALCIASPVMRQQSLTYAFQDNFFFVLGDPAYKIHYYLISLILITMVCGLVYGIAKMLRTGDTSQKRPLFLRGISTAALVALCVFANTTAFFRQAAPIQTPLASILTGLFFVMLGAAVGVYAGSYLLSKGTRLGIGIPILFSISAAGLMYVGEAVMMKGNLYRFGTGWFFDGLPGIVLAPADVLIVLLSGGLAWLVLSSARKHENWPDKRLMIAAVALCAAVAVAGPIIAMSAPKNTDNNIYGCYVFDKNIYTNPLSSFMAFEWLPYVYGFDENTFVIADKDTGYIQSYSIEYFKTPVGADEFTSKTDYPPGSFFSLPDLTGFKERYLLAVMSDVSGPKYGLYRLDGGIWLTELRGDGIWSIYRLVKSDSTMLADLLRIIEHYEDNPLVELPSGFYERQMTLKDVFALARKGEALTLNDFEPFAYQLTGEDFTERRYDVIGADTVFIRVKEERLESAQLFSALHPLQLKHNLSSHKFKKVFVQTFQVIGCSDEYHRNQIIDIPVPKAASNNRLDDVVRCLKFSCR